MRSGRGPSVILVHGYGESLVAWRGLFDRLAAHADVVALDLPGFGLADKPPAGYTTEALGTAVLAAATAMRIDSFVIVGHSLGGAVAVAAALAAPSRIRALVLIDPAGVSSPAMLPDSVGAVAASARAAIAEYEAQRSRFTSVHDPAWLGEDSVAAAYLPADDPAYRAALEAVLREFDFAYLVPERLRQLVRPTLILWGAYDRVVPVAQGTLLQRELPAARLVVFARTWHRPHVERPVETADSVLSLLRTLEESSHP